MNTYLSAASEPMLLVMIYQPIHDIWFYLLAAAILQAVAVYTWRYWRTPAALYLSLSAAARTVWLLALVLIMVSPALDDKISWAKIQQFSAIVMLPIALMIALHITDQKPAVILTVRTVMLALTALFLLALLTGDRDGWEARGRSFCFRVSIILERLKKT